MEFRNSLEHDQNFRMELQRKLDAIETLTNNKEKSTGGVKLPTLKSLKKGVKKINAKISNWHHGLHGVKQKIAASDEKNTAYTELPEEYSAQEKVQATQSQMDSIESETQSEMSESITNWANNLKPRAFMEILKELMGVSHIDDRLVPCQLNNAHIDRFKSTLKSFKDREPISNSKIEFLMRNLDTRPQTANFKNDHIRAILKRTLVELGEDSRGYGGNPVLSSIDSVMY